MASELRTLLERLIHTKDFSVVVPLLDFLREEDRDVMQKRQFHSFFLAIGVLRQRISKISLSRGELGPRYRVNMLREWMKFVDRMEEIFWNELHNINDVLAVLEMVNEPKEQRKEGKTIPITRESIVNDGMKSFFGPPTEGAKEELAEELRKMWDARPKPTKVELDGNDVG